MKVITFLTKKKSVKVTFLPFLINNEAFFLFVKLLKNHVGLLDLSADLVFIFELGFRLFFYI